MDDRKEAALELVERVVLPATKEELINALLVENAPGNVLDLFERLPEGRYDNKQQLTHDLEELTAVHRNEVSQAKTYNDFLATVLMHTGDIQHSTKETFNHVVDQVLAISRQEDAIEPDAAEEMRHRLYAAWVDLRKGMTEVYDDKAPINPNRDLPEFEGEEN